MKRMADIPFKKTFGDVPESFQARVQYTLHRRKEEKYMKRKALRTVWIAAFMTVVVCGALAAALSPTAGIFGWFYGADKQQELLSGSIAPSGESTQVGDVIYTIDDVILSNGVIYGSGTMKAAAGAPIVLIPEDYKPSDPAGYDTLYGGASVPAGAPTYADKASAIGATIRMTRCLPDGVLNPDGSLASATIGYADFPREDGTVAFMFEFKSDDAKPEHTLQMYCANWEITPAGEYLPETRQAQTWIVTVTPKP